MTNLKFEKKQLSKLSSGSLDMFKTFIIILSFLFLTSCKTKDPETEIPINPDIENEDEKPEDEVIVLNIEDVEDYDKFYKPQEFKKQDWLRNDSKWSFVRSKQSEHFTVFWEKGFGLDPNSDDVRAELRVDIDDLLEKAEMFFDLNVNILKFADYDDSNVSKYKMQIYLLYQTEWAAFGGGVDDVIGGLWINPATCKPVGSTIAHEIGHSFQYQIYADLIANKESSHDFTRGFRYGFGGNGGNAFWEQTAQWQSFQSYPEEAFISYNFGVHMDNYNRHVCHEWHRYASYFIHYYWAEKHGIDMVAKVWREAIAPEDPIEAYMRINDLTMENFNNEMYDAATKFVTWDLDNIREIGKNFIGKHLYKLYQLDDGSYQVAYNKCPGTTGYNVIPLNVPEAGTSVLVEFNGIQPGSALAPNDPGNYSDDGKNGTTKKYNDGQLTRAGWRYGYVALLSNGERVYGDMHKKGASTVEFVVPENCERLWFVVLGAPTSYKAHPWDEIESNDEQWPYKIKITNSDLLGTINLNPNEQPKDITLTYNVSFKADDVGYTGTAVNLYNTGDIAKLAQAFVQQPTTIASLLQNPKSSPAPNKITFSAVESQNNDNYETTANGYGFWFDSNGDVIGWGAANDSKIFVEFNADSMEFSIGQYPGKSKSGDKYTVKEALTYIKNGATFKATFIFNITIL